MNSRNLQELIRNLRVFYKCPSCGAAYRSGDIVFLGRVEEHCFMQLTCHDCSLPILATILLNISAEDLAQKPQSTRSSRRTDLKPKERQHMLNQGAIESQEIAAFYHYLTNGSSDYQALIGKSYK